MVTLPRDVTRKRHGHLLSAMALYALLAYLAPSWAKALHADTSYEAMTAWVAQPYHAAALAALLIIGFHHFSYGLCEMAKDYISNLFWLCLSISALRIACFISAVAGLGAILKIYLGI